MDVVYCIFYVFHKHVIFGITTIAHLILLSAVAATVITLKRQKENPNFLVVTTHQVEVVQFTLVEKE